MESSHVNRADLIDPAHIASLGRIEIVARWVVDGFLAGLHRSPRKGFSVEFAEFRPYQTGDDLRYIDWKIVARADRWMIKQFEEETNTRAALVLDVSKSMDWTGSPDRLTKLRYAEQLVAALSLLFIRQRDAVGLVRYDESLRTVVPPRARNIQWMRIIRALEQPGSGTASKMADALGHAARLVRRPGFVVLVSDLLLDRDEIENALRAVRAAGHQLIVLHIMDPMERDLELVGEAVFADTESPLAIPATVADVRTAYQRTVLKAIEEWRSTLFGLGASYEVIPTDAPFGVPLRRALVARQRIP